MYQHCYDSAPCRWCRFGSRVFGHQLTKLLGKHWDKITISEVAPLLDGLRLEIVGGLATRGYTEHDIDVIGNEEDVAMLVKRLTQKKIFNLVHYCGPSESPHSHMRALINGFLVTFLGNKMYMKSSRV